jgi:hypothetical protein
MQFCPSRLLTPSIGFVYRIPVLSKLSVVLCLEPPNLQVKNYR